MVSVRLGNVFATVILQVQIVQLLSLLILLNVVICVHSIKEFVPFKIRLVFIDTFHVFVILVILELIVQLLFALEIVITMENAQLLITVLVLEEKWVISAKLTAGVVDTVLAMPMVLANVMMVLFLIQHQKNVNLHVLTSQAQIVMPQIH